MSDSPELHWSGCSRDPYPTGIIYTFQKGGHTLTSTLVQKVGLEPTTHHSLLRLLSVLQSITHFFMIALPTELLLRVAVCPAVKRLSALFERGGEVRVGG